MRRVSVLLVASTLAACTASTPIVDPTDGSASPTATGSPTPRPDPARAVRAVVPVEGGLLLYDVASDSVSEVARGSNLRQPVWLDATAVAVAQDAGTVSTVRRVDLEARTTSELARLDGLLMAYDITADGTVLAAMTHREDFAVLELHYLVGEGQVQRITTMPIEARGISIDDQFLVAFDPSESRVLVVNTASPGGTEDTAGLQVRSLDGRLEFWVDSSRAPTAATWLPAGGLVFRSRDGVRRWKPGNASSVGLGSLSSWFSPSGSPDSRAVAYDTGMTTRRVQPRRIALRTGEVTDIGPSGRANPVYAAVNEVWVQIVQRCQPDCLEPFVLGPQVFAVNPNTGAERQLAVPTLRQIAVWYE